MKLLFFWLIFQLFLQVSKESIKVLSQREQLWYLGQRLQITVALQFLVTSYILIVSFNTMDRQVQLLFHTLSLILMLVKLIQSQFQQ